MRRTRIEESRNKKCKNVKLQHTSDVHWTWSQFMSTSAVRRNKHTRGKTEIGLKADIEQHMHWTRETEKQSLQAAESQKQRTACLIFRGGRYNEHSEINEIGQEYDEWDGKDNTRARQCKLRRKLFTWLMKHAPKMKMIASHERQTRQQLPQKFIYICCPKSCNFVWWDPWDISASQNPPLGVGDGRGRILKAYLHNLSVYLVQVSWCAVIIGLKSTLNVCISTLFSL